jgi:hypothetical protein
MLLKIQMSSWLRSAPVKLPPKTEGVFPVSFETDPTFIAEVIPFPNPSRLYSSAERNTSNSETLLNEITIASPAEVAEVVPVPIKEVIPYPSPSRLFPSKNSSPAPRVSANNETASNDQTPRAPSNTEVVPYPSPSRLFSSGQRQANKPASSPLKANPRSVVKNPTVPQAPVVQMEAPHIVDVTIAIPLFNGVEFLADALQSVKRQTYGNWEGIIGINGYGISADAIVTRVSQVVQKAGLLNRFRITNLAEAEGAAQAINALVAEATTPFIAHLDADDIWLPKKLEIQMETIMSDPEIGIVGTWCRYFGESTNSPNLPGGLLRKSDFVKMNPLIHSSILIKREIANYTDEFVTYDYDCWIRNMLDGVKIFNNNSILVLHRIHKSSFFNASNTQKPELVRKKYNLV